MNLKQPFILQIKNQLGSESDQFLKALHELPPTSIRVNPHKLLQLPNHMEKIKWNDHGYYLDQRPSFTLDPRCFL